MERRSTVLFFVFLFLVFVILYSADISYDLQFNGSECEINLATDLTPAVNRDELSFKTDVAAYAAMQTQLAFTITITETQTTTATTTATATATATATTTITATTSKENRESTMTNDPLPFFDPAPSEVYEAIQRNLIPFDHTLVTAVVNHGMIEYTLNWIASLKRTNVNMFLVFCIDADAYQALVDAGYVANAVKIPWAWYHRIVPSSKFEEYREGSYNSITHAKSLVVERLLHMDIIVVFSDVDIVWLSPRILDFLTTMWQVRGETLMLFSQEGFDRTTINSGFYLMRPANTTMRLMHETITIQDSEPEMTQQQAMNRALLNIDLNITTSPMVFLDLFYFPNGLVYFYNNLPTSWNLQAMIAHANYFVGDEKKQALKRFNLWYIDDIKKEEPVD
ncbi:nucleotide-diphospho-sugar transferase-domain-containing protein, partial [Jimgerdemannia flammicorona]